MHYWGYVIEKVLGGEPRRTTRRTGGRSGQSTARDERRWSRTAPWL